MTPPGKRPTEQAGTEPRSATLEVDAFTLARQVELEGQRKDELAWCQKCAQDSKFHSQFLSQCGSMWWHVQ